MTTIDTRNADRTLADLRAVPLFPETGQGVAGASAAYEDAAADAADVERAQAWRAVLARNLL